MGKKLFEFIRFPPEPPEIGAFRDNIGDFLETYGAPLKTRVNKMKVWMLTLWPERGCGFPLYILEDQCSEQEIECKECLYSGWKGHLLTKRRYHFLIPAEEDWKKASIEDGDLYKESNLLHGLIHCNGYGHLLTINGAESGSKTLFGRDIMNFWERICTNLAVRKVTVRDLSMKHSMDIRLLYGIAYGHTWFGRWRYEFCHGSFGVTAERYEKALADLSSLTLDQVVKDLGNTQNGIYIEALIEHYSGISNTQLKTIRDLLYLMISCKTRTRKSISPSSLPPSEKTTNMTEQQKSNAKGHGREYTAEKLENTANVFASILKKTNKAITKLELIDEAEKVNIRDNRLINHVISMIDDHVWEGYVVKRTKAHGNKYWYSVHPIGGDEGIKKPGPKLFGGDEGRKELGPKSFGINVYKDIEYFYQNVFKNYPVAKVKEDIEVILNTKYFFKEYPLGNVDNKLTYFCIWPPDSKGVEIRSAEEVIILELDSTYGELLKAAESAFKDSFYGMDAFHVRGVRGLEESKKLRIFDNNDQVSNLVGSGSKIYLLGDGIDMQNNLKFEGGKGTDRMNCICGARGEDGEGTFFCTGCGVMQHIICGLLLEEDRNQNGLFCQNCKPSVDVRK